jgi:hypothetical protein
MFFDGQLKTQKNERKTQIGKQIHTIEIKKILLKKIKNQE